MTKLSRLGEAVSFFLGLLPALLTGLFCLRAVELAAGIQAGAEFSAIAAIAAAALGQDLAALARYLPALFLFSLPFLLIPSRQARLWGLGLAWSLLLLAQTSLVQYFLTARVPLGADLFAYSLRDIHKTVQGGTGTNPALIAGLLLALAVLGTLLVFLGRRPRPALPPLAASAVLGVSLLVMIFAPGRPGFAGAGSEYAYDLSLNKAVFFLDDSLAYLAPSRQRAGPGPSLKAAAVHDESFHYLNPEYPFLRSEQTPDALGPYFKIKPGSPPNLVFVIIEGLGRSFSGPGASLGSFTPQLDLLAEKSLYWENFLAVQGRTFGVLPSIFGSLPFGAKGFADLGERMPAHISLLSLLKGHGYRLKFYCGFDLDFENIRAFLSRQGMDLAVGEAEFGAGYPRSNSWGYADGELVSRALAGEAADSKQPYVSVLKTTTMHTPYTFLGQPAFGARLESRLDELGVAAGSREPYRAFSNMYTSILYTDEAVGRFMEESRKNPAYQNTIFVITGDHRLPEIPMGARIDRYHVPLLIYSPLLKAPARIKAVSSHFDLAPSLAAFFSRNYGLKGPLAVTWLGSGLDMEASFRNLHDIPIKQTKTNLVDFVSGTWYLNQDTLYKLKDGMRAEPVRDEAALAAVRAQFGSFRSSNDKFAASLSLLPKWVPGQETVKTAAKPPAAAATPAVFSVEEVRAPGEARAGKLEIEAVFANTGKAGSGAFIPLVVLLSADGREVSESYGPLQLLDSGGKVSLKLRVKSQGVSPGKYFLAVVPSHPRTGKRVGSGKFRIPVVLHPDEK